MEAFTKCGDRRRLHFYSVQQYVFLEARRGRHTLQAGFHPAHAAGLGARGRYRRSKRSLGIPARRLLTAGHLRLADYVSSISQVQQLVSTFTESSSPVRIDNSTTRLLGLGTKTQLTDGRCSTAVAAALGRGRRHHHHGVRGRELELHWPVKEPRAVPVCCVRRLLRQHGRTLLGPRRPRLLEGRPVCVRVGREWHHLR